MDALAALFADIEKTPIITGQAQEFWLGVMSVAPANWGELDSYNDPSLLAAIMASIRMRFSRMEAACKKTNRSAPQFDIWAAETSKAYQDIFGFQHSDLHRFVRSANKNADPKLIGQIYDIIELFCLLPEPTLDYLASSVENKRVASTQDQYRVWIEKHPIKHVWALAEERARQARATLVTGYLRYALRIARNAVGQRVDYLDLVQEGALGLMRAAERYDYRTGARFAVFASSWIWQGISRAIADQGRTIRLPVHMHERVCTLQRALEANVNDSEEEVAIANCLVSSTYDEQEEDEPVETENRALKKKLRRKAIRLLEYCQPIIPLDLELSDDLFDEPDLTASAPVTLDDCIADPSQDVEYINQQRERLPLIQELLASLQGGYPTRDINILRLRYGLEDGEEHTLEEVGQHFGITRERVRQIESKLLVRISRSFQQIHGRSKSTQLSRRSQTSLPRNINRYIEEQFAATPSKSNKTRAYEFRHLDHYLERLPGGDWHAYRVPGGSTRQEQVAMALRILEAPAHYTTITEQVNNLLTNTELDENQIYGLLMKYEDAFVRVGEGFFGLAEWEHQRVAKDEPEVPFCPTPLPDPPDQPNAFLESVMVARDVLRTPCNTETFLRALVRWAGLPWAQPHWVCHGALSAYYVVGVIPYVFYTPGKNQQLSLTLPDVDLQTLREYCLDTLSRRLQAMPEFWWLLQRHQPIRVSELSSLFVASHPLGLDDVANRLTLLLGIGAVQKSTSGGRYQLTHLGEKMAARWARQPESITTATSEPPKEVEWDFAELSLY